MCRRIKYEPGLLVGIFLMITKMIFPDLMITLQLLMRFPSGSARKQPVSTFLVFIPVVTKYPITSGLCKMSGGASLALNGLSLSRFHKHPPPLELG